MQLSMQCRQAWPKGAVLAHRVAAFEHSTGMTGGSNVRANEAVDWLGVGAGGDETTSVCYKMESDREDDRCRIIASWSVSRPERVTGRRMVRGDYICHPFEARG